MGKHERIAAQIAHLETRGGWHPCYIEYFRLFNAQEYYAAHDVLEHIWLDSEGEQYVFYKALIQFAGGFVHLQHHHREPQHRIHGRRLRPAARLFLRAAGLLETFPDHHHEIDVARMRAEALRMAEAIVRHNYEVNPWVPDKAPFIAPPR